MLLFAPTHAEILVNAADNKQRDASMKEIRVTINAETGAISVWNDGKGIPVEVHAEHQARPALSAAAAPPSRRPRAALAAAHHGSPPLAPASPSQVYIPELVFGHLLTGENFEDEQQRVVGGRNGYGAKLANIFSTAFTVETNDSGSGQNYVQSWSANMAEAGKPKITKAKKKSDYTCVTFTPDFARFGMAGLDADATSLLEKRVYDIAGTSHRSVKVKLNGTMVPASPLSPRSTFLSPRLVAALA